MWAGSANNGVIAVFGPTKIGGVFLSNRDLIGLVARYGVILKGK